MEYPNNIIKVYGPYIRKKDGREIVRLKLNDGSIKTKSYARYLKELELGRELDRNEETVDHKNRNHLDNSGTNLQVLSRTENAKKSALRRVDIVDNCIWCGVSFTLTQHQINTRARQKAGPFCSRSCTGKYGAARRSGAEVKDNSIGSVNRYYRNDDV